MNTYPPLLHLRPAPAPAPRARPGRGTRLTSNRAGFAYSTAAAGSYPHPFKPALGSLSVTFARGLVEGFEPVIKGVPISGGEGGTPPVLALDPKLANAQGESWCCLEVTPNAQGQVDAQSRVEMAHRGQPLSLDPALGRCPVALLLWREGRPVQVLEILYFNVRYQRVAIAAGPVRHLFF